MLNLTNYFDHPGDNRYTVFRFREADHADHFQGLLLQQAVDFERHEENDDDGDLQYLFGVNKRFQKEAIRANFLTHAEFRKPFIGNKWMKYTLLLFTVGVMIIAILGFLKARGIL